MARPDAAPQREEARACNRSARVVRLCPVRTPKSSLFLALICLSIAGSAPSMVACGSDDSKPAQNPIQTDGGGDAAQLNEAGATDAAGQQDAPATDGSPPEAAADAVGPDSEPGDSGAGCADKAKNCATAFGSLFTKANGRADGTLVALVRPVDQQCTAANNDHAIVQLSILGQVQRLVVSVSASRSPARPRRSWARRTKKGGTRASTSTMWLTSGSTARTSPPCPWTRRWDSCVTT